jgi:hypothetical protein
MKCIYKTTLDKKSELMTILEADPYGEKEAEPYHHVSFGRNGYKCKDGAMLDEDRNKMFVFIRGPDEFEKFCLFKFKDLAVRSKPEDEARIIAKFEAEEGNAEVGMGAIFG